METGLSERSIPLGYTNISFYSETCTKSKSGSFRYDFVN
jgi:hypothetical protein